ncbi:glycoside hydrolase family 35 protein [Rhizoctonia solani AG-1 IA]|uniref:beta-galactosidase n=1 Tax=Thanatephorus cucumeris (strain AG1-IA) TaxID=983506 RepID=L8WWS5_THACA|nr:glycoside hydrolase family 35 protein [Rhizoctonia solani AG-1 IA]
MISEKDAWGVNSTLKHRYQRRTWSKKWLALPLLAVALIHTSPQTWLKRGCKHAVNVQSNPQHTPISSNGRTDLVQWDGKSLFIKGQRIFLWSGEFHTFRLPAPELWGDILEKTKAAGFNAISVYVHCTRPSFQAGYEVGTMGCPKAWGTILTAHSGPILLTNFGIEFVFVQPYINAEVSGGGIPHWATSEISGHLRTNSTDYTRAWEPYVDAIADILVKGNWQIGDKTGGPVILENEYLATHSPGHKYKAPYMAALAKRFVDKGVVVPLTYNDAYMGGNYATGEIDQCEEGSKEGGEGGSHGKGRCGVELYGVDSYPQSFKEDHLMRGAVRVKYSYLPMRIANICRQEVSNMVGQAQYGLYYGRDWTRLMLKYASIQGYEACRQLTGPEFSQVFNLGLWANNVGSRIAILRGTPSNFIRFARRLKCHSEHKAYDYGAAITETRRLTSKYAELKRQGLFLRSVPEFYATDVIGNSTDSGRPSRLLTTRIPFSYLLQTIIPQWSLIIQKSLELYYAIRILALNFISFDTWTRHHGKRSGVSDLDSVIDAVGCLSETPPISDSLCLRLYILQLLRNLSHSPFLRSHYLGALPKYYSETSCTARLDLLGAPLAYYMRVKWEAEMSSSCTDLRQKARVTQISRHISISQHVSSGSQALSVVTVLPGSVGLVTVFETSSQLVLFADSETAGNFWAPVLAPQESDSFSELDSYANFYQFGTNSSVLVGGPYLVREARLSSEGELALRGDLEKESMLTVIAELGAVRRVFWNGFPVDTMLQDSSTGTSGVLRFQIAPRFRTNDITVPELANWRYQDSLPEVKDGFDDSKWTVANRTSTNIPEGPHFGDKVLYGCDYGFCEGAVVWRGHFKGDSGVTGVRLVINGGFASWRPRTETAYAIYWQIPETDQVYHFPADSTIQGEDNVVTVVQDNMGLEMTVDWTADSSKSPRGIRGYELIGGAFTEWKVQGKKGGYTGFKDKLRGILNEGGLYGERQGWHLPDFDDSEWAKVDLSNGLPNSQAGVGWFRTTFSLDIPQAYDVPISFEFKNEPAPYRALLFVNGPQFKFPVPEGILNHHGENTVALAIWSMENTQLSPNLKLTIEGVFDSGYKFDSPL